MNCEISLYAARTLSSEVESNAFSLLLTWEKKSWMLTKIQTFNCLRSINHCKEKDENEEVIMHSSSSKSKWFICTSKSKTSYYLIFHGAIEIGVMRDGPGWHEKQKMDRRDSKNCNLSRILNRSMLARIFMNNEYKHDTHEPTYTNIHLLKLFHHSRSQSRTVNWLSFAYVVHSYIHFNDGTPIFVQYFTVWLICDDDDELKRGISTQREKEKLYGSEWHGCSNGKLLCAPECHILECQYTYKPSERENDRNQECFAASSYKFQLLVWSFGETTRCVLALTHFRMFLVCVRSHSLSRSLARSHSHGVCLIFKRHLCCYEHRISFINIKYL